jgi:hypothetical protein
MNHPQLRFVSGKGGVGKTYFSLYLQRQDPRFCLAELTTSLKSECDKWNQPAPPIYRFSQKDLAEAFLRRTLKVGVISQWIAENKLFQNLLDLAPNLTELLLLEQWTQLSAETPFVVDAPSTGHFIALFEAIHGAREIFESGSLRSIADELHHFFSATPEKTQIYIVSLPEQSSLIESQEIEDRIKTLYPKIKLFHVLNKRHFAPENPPPLKDPWYSLAFKRPLLEEQRIAGRRFEMILPDGVPT